MTEVHRPVHERSVYDIPLNIWSQSQLDIRRKYMACCDLVVTKVRQVAKIFVFAPTCVFFYIYIVTCRMLCVFIVYIFVDVVCIKFSKNDTFFSISLFFTLS